MRNYYKPTFFRVFWAAMLPLPLAEEIMKMEAFTKFVIARRSDLRVRLNKPAKLHITLSFLGDITKRNCDALIRAAKPELEKISEFTVDLASLEIFPPVLPRVLALKPAKTSIAPMQKAAKKLLKSARSCGFEPDAREFLPHVTLARFEPKKYVKWGDNGNIDTGKDFYNSLAAQLKAEGKLPLLRFKVSEIFLLKSDNTEQESQYTELARCKLKVETEETAAEIKVERSSRRKKSGQS